MVAECRPCSPSATVISPALGDDFTMVAGHARSAGPTVVTNNKREFDLAPGLLVEDRTVTEA